MGGCAILDVPRSPSPPRKVFNATKTLVRLHERGLQMCDDYTKILDDEHVGVSDEGDANNDRTRGDSGGGWNDED